MKRSSKQNCRGPEPSLIKRLPGGAPIFESKPTAKADGAADAARALAERGLIERPERPPSLQQAQEREMRSRVVGGLTRIGCTNATNDYIVARDEEEARTLALYL